MSITIKNRPFCGHDDVEIEEVGHAEFSVTCPECRAIGPVGSEIMSAIADWNKAGRLEETTA